MSVAATRPPTPQRWTREECARLADYERFELIEGVLIPKVSKNFPHFRAVAWLVERLRVLFPGQLRVLQEAPIDVRPEDNPTSDPEPDIVVLATSLDDLGRRPRAEDLLLVVEVSDSTLELDLSVKCRLYAAGSTLVPRFLNTGSRISRAGESSFIAILWGVPIARWSPTQPMRSSPLSARRRLRFESEIFSHRMSVAATLPPPQRWTREECARLADYERFELIEGALIPKVSNTPHVRILARLMRRLRSIFSDDLRVLQESPIDVRPDDNRRASRSRTQLCWPGASTS